MHTQNFLGEAGVPHSDLYYGDSTAPSADYVYAQEIEKGAPGIIDAVNTVRGTAESLIDAIARVRTQLQMTEAQRAYLDIQISRARAGLPPISASQHFGGGSDLSGGVLLLLALGALLLMSNRGKS